MSSKSDTHKVSNKTVVMVGCFDTKGADFAYLYTCLLSQGLKVLTINVGVLGTTSLFPVHYTAETVAVSGGSKISKIREENDRGSALEIMGNGAEKIVADLVTEGKVSGIIGMGGGGGTFVSLKAMKSVPFGIPKICVSTLATKDLSKKVGDKDIVLIPSIVDVAGLNKISKVVIGQAAGALYGMIHTTVKNDNNIKGSIAISVFGNTAIAADKSTEILKSKGYDVLAFHAVGSGGATMEALTSDGVFDAVLDLTTTELADELCGGICSSGPDRLTAAGQLGIPQVIVPGCIDMVNFGALSTVPEKYKKRQLFSWAPDVTLMRTNAEENIILGKQIAEKINASNGPVTLLFPIGGLSKVGGEGEVFHNPKIDGVLFESIRKNVKKSVKIVEVNANINTVVFAEQAVKELLELVQITNRK
ncbi:Tm-1-like ATP-binding domain-containing protein [Maribacter confluentis]|uniref:Tm-1-like ATP-binding domain-containing protein n=1 Tax=Maribacter confluentis TaxID=1656093 RepID=A0ABT8RML5_9FLAO|nr:Tm-1-like ATP-binding domain-containing protein [Maribacter confluentis]MDO1512170.1 Tm-1-like ATP-binding domain-containing protein [Maribacter confluentis]